MFAADVPTAFSIRAEGFETKTLQARQLAGCALSNIPTVSPLESPIFDADRETCATRATRRVERARLDGCHMVSHNSMLG